MSLAPAALALLVLSTASVLPALAQNSTSGAPPNARKEGGIAGDPRGAIRALGGTSQNDFEMGDNKVDVPRLGSPVGRGQTAGTPPGTTPPR